MKTKITEMRSSFLKQLQQAVQETDQLKQRLAQLATQSDQLKGAIYALDAALASDQQPASEVSETPAVEQEQKG